MIKWLFCVVGTVVGGWIGFFWSCSLAVQETINYHDGGEDMPTAIDWISRTLVCGVFNGLLTYFIVHFAAHKIINHVNRRHIAKLLE